MRFLCKKKCVLMQGFSCLYEEVCYYWNGCGIATFRVWMRLIVSLRNRRETCLWHCNPLTASCYEGSERVKQPFF